MEGFFCEKLLERLLLHLEEDEEFFWDKLLRRGEFEVEALLENNDFVEEEEEAWLLEPVSFFDVFLFSSITSQRNCECDDSSYHTMSLILCV